MLNFIEWCKSKNLAIEGYSAKPAMKKAEKAKYKDMMSGDSHPQEKELDDYKGHIANNGTVEPFEVKKGSGKLKQDNMKAKK